MKRNYVAVINFLNERRRVFGVEGISEPRDAKGRTRSLHSLFAAALLGMVTMCRSLRETEEETEEWSKLGRVLGVRGRVPKSTLADFLPRLDEEELKEKLHETIRREHRRKSLAPVGLPFGFVAVDGKNVRTSNEMLDQTYSQKQTGEDGRPRWVHMHQRAVLISSAAAVCIHDEPIPAHTNETGVLPTTVRALKRAYGRSDLFRAVMTDAGPCSLDNADFIDGVDLAYVFRFKDNQPELSREARRVFADICRERPPEAESEWERDDEHGFIMRRLWRTGEMTGWNGWRHARQVWYVETLAKPAEDAEAAVIFRRFYVTNLLYNSLRPVQILTLIRAYWRIENACNRTVDVEAWAEDTTTGWSKKGAGLRVVSLLRMLAYNLVALAKYVHLRSADSRRITWRRLRKWLLHVLRLDTLPGGAETPPANGLHQDA